MPSGTYERYGLLSNPFRDLSSESLEDVSVFHVNLTIDETLHTIKEEVLEKENKGLVAIVGAHGAGKTERLLLAQTEARQRGAFVVYFDLTDKTTWVLRGLAQEFEKASKLGGFAKVFSSPAWYRTISGYLRQKDQKYDPVKAGKAIGEALNANAPAFLLLNDLHNLSQSQEADVFARTLQEIADAIKPGVLVMFGAYPSYLVSITKHRPPLASRINRIMVIPTLTTEDAGLLLAKKLMAKRLVENLDPLYPFDLEAVAALTEASYGNPRRLLELADRAIEYGVSHRSYRVDVEIIRAALAPKKGQPAEGGGAELDAAPRSLPPASTDLKVASAPVPRLTAAAGAKDQA